MGDTELEFTMLEFGKLLPSVTYEFDTSSMTCAPSWFRSPLSSLESMSTTFLRPNLRPRESIEYFESLRPMPEYSLLSLTAIIFWV